MAYTRPAAKTTGDTITLTDWNSLRDSLIAGIDVVTTKGDLMVGTAADTVTRLGVGANGSTLVADSGTASGLAWQIPARCVLRNSTEQDPTPGQWHKLTWNAENVDVGAMHSTTTNPERITIPAGGAGMYLIGANIGFVTTAHTGDTGYYGVRFLYQGLALGPHSLAEMEMNNNEYWVGFQMPTSPNVADYYECEVFTSLDVDISASSLFWMVRLV